MLTATDPFVDLSVPQAITFGKQQHLIGIMQPPQEPQTDNFAVVILTAGMLPSSGPFRLHVDLADALAKAGIRSLRFDLSGIGESLAIGGSEPSLQRAASEIRSAIDCLQQRQQIEHVALFGLCSGADDALFAAGQDERICGLFSVDGCGYRTTKYYVQRFVTNYLPKLTSGRAWRSRLQKWGGSQVETLQTLMPGSDVREFPDRDSAATQLHQLVRRGVQKHFHYTGGVGDYYNYERQFHDMFAGTSLATSGAIHRIGVSFFPDSDHVAYLVEHRRRLVALATERLVAMSGRGRS